MRDARRLQTSLVGPERGNSTAGTLSLRHLFISEDKRRRIIFARGIAWSRSQMTSLL